MNELSSRHDCQRCKNERLEFIQCEIYKRKDQTLHTKEEERANGHRRIGQRSFFCQCLDSVLRIHGPLISSLSFLFLGYGP